MNLTNKEVIHIIGENIEYIQFKRLLEYKDIIEHAYTLKNKDIYFGPNFSNKEALTNYKYLCDELKIDVNNLIKPNQSHTDKVQIITKKNTSSIEYNPNYLKDTDGLITNKNNIIIATTNADCILFLLFDPINKVISNIHSGWRGTLQEIVVNTINEMIKEYNSNPKDIICCVCPSIRKCHFEVDSDVKDLFINKFSYLSNINEIIEQKQNKYHIDTILLNKTLLKNIGLKEENIIDSSICSICHANKINSYRFDKENYKLSTAIITLK